jgi:hypothetical protein
MYSEISSCGRDVNIDRLGDHSHLKTIQTQNVWNQRHLDLLVSHKRAAVMHQALLSIAPSTSRKHQVASTNLTLEHAVSLKGVVRGIFYPLTGICRLGGLAVWNIARDSPHRAAKEP